MDAVHIPGHCHINSPSTQAHPLRCSRFLLPSLQSKEEKGKGVKFVRFTLSVCRHPLLFGVIIVCCLLCYCCPVPYLCHKMGEWVPSMVTEVKLQWLVEKGVTTRVRYPIGSHFWISETQPVKRHGHPQQPKTKKFYVLATN
jgi:hypothetical protein